MAGGCTGCGENRTAGGAPRWTPSILSPAPDRRPTPPSGPPISPMIPDASSCPTGFPRRDGRTPTSRCGPRGIGGRRVFLGGETDGEYLPALLDGAKWARTALTAVLRRLRTQGVLSAVRIMAVDITEDRFALLGRSGELRDYLRRDLLPWSAGESHQHPADRVIVCGQSLGGLATVDLDSPMPQEVALPIGNSRPFWFPAWGGELGGGLGAVPRTGHADRWVSVRGRSGNSRGRRRRASPRSVTWGRRGPGGRGASFSASPAERLTAGLRMLLESRTGVPRRISWDPGSRVVQGGACWCV